jgi:DNA polymerase kappa
MEMDPCPICGKFLKTDNTGLNAHIDFCLSRKAIREAQTEPDSLINPVGGFQWGKDGSADRGKITSTKKRKKG